MTLVGLVGAKRAGKDSVAAVLVDRHDYRRFAFADALKALAVEVDDGVRSIVAREGWEAAKEAEWVRRSLQILGVAVREHVGTDSWVNVVDRQLAGYHGDAVITDVRFDNEVEMIRRRGGYIVRVDRPGLSHDDTHVSEELYRRIFPDVAIENSGTLEALEHRALAIVSELEDRDDRIREPMLALGIGLDSHGIGGKWARAAEDGALL